MRIRRIIQAALLAVAVSVAGSASADEQSFLRAEHEKIIQLLRQDVKDQAGRQKRDQQISAVLANMVDYDELTKRCFREHWKDLTDEQKEKVKAELKRLVEKTQKRNLNKGANYEITYKGQERSGDSDVKVKTSARSLVNRREPEVAVDYIVSNKNGRPQLVDIITEHSPLTRNYYTQFHQMLTNKDQGFDYLLKKVREKADKRD
jgi:ABC-type transporter MlaC component